MGRPVPLLSARPNTPVGPSVLVALLLLLTVAAVGFLPDETRDALMQEGAVVETITVALYCAAVLVLLPHARLVLPFTVILAAFAMREFDLDKSLFTEGLLKSRQYLGDTVSASERALSAAILGALLVAGILCLRRGLHGLPARLRAPDGVAVAVLLGILMLGTAKVSDGAVNKLATYGIIVGENLRLHLLAYEELAEGAGALCFLLAAAAFVRALGRAPAIATNLNAEQSR